MLSRVLLAFCTILALVVGTRAADDKDAKKASPDKAKRETVVITKHGEPVAKLVPIEREADEIFGFFRGKGSITGDVVSPVLSHKEWGNLG